MWPVEHETHLTQLSSKLWWALTHKAVQHRVALAAVLARSAVTLVPLDFTVSAHKTGRTLAVVTPRALLEKKTEKLRVEGQRQKQGGGSWGARKWIIDSNKNIPTLHVAPLWHWPWQPLISEEEKLSFIMKHYEEHEHLSTIRCNLQGGMCTDYVKVWKRSN